MVDIAQLVEQLIVVQQVARSSRVIHPMKPRSGGVFCFSPHAAIYDVLPYDILIICVCRWRALCDRCGQRDILESAEMRAVMRRQEDEGPSGRWTGLSFRFRGSVGAVWRLHR